MAFLLSIINTVLVPLSSKSFRCNPITRVYSSCPHVIFLIDVLLLIFYDTRGVLIITFQLIKGNMKININLDHGLIVWAKMSKKSESWAGKYFTNLTYSFLIIISTLWISILKKIHNYIKKIREVQLLNNKIVIGEYIKFTLLRVVSSTMKS